MLKSACICMVVALAFPIAAVQAQVQPGDYQPRRARTYASDAGRTLTAPSTVAPASIVAEFLRDRNVAIEAASLVTAGDAMTAQNGMTVVRFEQLIAGLRLYGVQAKASFTSRGELVHLSENLVAQTAAALGAPLVNESQALNAVLARLYPADRPAAAPIRREGQRVVFERTPFFHDSPTVTRVAFVAADGSIRAGLLVDTWSERQNLLHQTLVGPDGTVLHVELLTSADAYNVFTQDPARTPQAVVSGPGAGNLQSPAGWLFAGAQNSVHIEGNNASAYLDADHNNQPDRGGSAVANGEFLTPADLTAAPTTTRNREVSVQNLFYLNNVLHDVLYQHGFTEAAGNFQENNFNQGGRGSDSVNAEAQDGDGLDNANFATPSDGRNPRMQMFLWTGGPTRQVVVNSPISAAYGAAGATFGPAPTATGQAGDVVLVNDGAGPSVSDGCEGAQAAVQGKIALVDRGACDFVVKVANAQAAGALAVIVANNADGDAIFSMGGTNRRIRIPAAMISQNDGAALKALTAPNATVRQHPNPPLMIDGTLDSDIVFHEYGHGLTSRMIGGMSGPLAGAIGEGASDALAMLLNGDDRIGEYASSNARGIRRFPYAGYPLTYGDVTGAEVHRDGEVYGAIIWRLIETFNAGGIPISTLFDYFVDGMNYTPAMPAYEDMRDGILQSMANSLTGHDCLIWEAFAHFGVGVGASGTATSGGVSISESFAVPAACTP